jgi:FlaA1/EpsC-like NDP-sugar epimerase
LHELTVKRDLTRTTNSRRLLLVGAGEAGLLLLHQLQNSDIHVVGFLDDDPALRGRTIGGWRVLGTTNDIEGIVSSHRVDEVVLCLVSCARSRWRICSAGVE